MQRGLPLGVTPYPRISGKMIRNDSESNARRSTLPVRFMSARTCVVFRKRLANANRGTSIGTLEYPPAVRL